MTAAYATSANLRARASIYDYQQPYIDLFGWVLGKVSWRSGTTVLDAGCGNGGWLYPLAQRIGPSGRLLGLDLSQGMLRDVSLYGPPPHPLLAAADIQALPLPTACCDV